MHTDRSPLLAEVEPFDGEGTEANLQQPSSPTLQQTASVASESVDAAGIQVGDGLLDSGSIHGGPGGRSGTDNAFRDAPSPSSRSVAPLMEAEGDRASPRRRPQEWRRRISHIFSLSRYSPTLLLITLLNLTVMLLLLLFWRQKIVDHSSKYL
ncbi:uncharacterized protein LOC119444065 [Dermacentor silvarum]|uniref:uncharacterized protein LOC119444065 n=1 Tax=Dermacentor silvarum TaxID=543639 RepID=UPI001897E00D|nr:uncharacterized protein LOC119444065 [Dermacentor silvarum]